MMVGGMPHAVSGMEYAVCGMPHPVQGMRHAPTILKCNVRVAMHFPLISIRKIL